MLLQLGLHLVISTVGAATAGIVGRLQAKRKAEAVVKVLQPIARGSLTLGDLIHAVRMNEQELIERVAAFEAEGLIRRVPASRGRTVLSLTDAGAELLEQCDRPTTF